MPFYQRFARRYLTERGMLANVANLEFVKGCKRFVKGRKKIANSCHCREQFLFANVLVRKHLQSFAKQS